MSDEVDVAALDESTVAAVWVQEFVKVVPDADEGLMLAWFANAIERGRRAGREEGVAEASLLLSGEGGRVSTRLSAEERERIEAWIVGIRYDRWNPTQATKNALMQVLYDYLVCEEALSAACESAAESVRLREALSDFVVYCEQHFSRTDSRAPWPTVAKARALLGSGSPQ